MKYFAVLLLAGLFAINAHSQVLGDYRSNGNVNFTTITNWQVLTALPSTWTAATTAPAANTVLTNNNTITVQTGNTLTYSSNFSFAANTDFLVVIQGSISSASTFTVSYGSGQSTVRIERNADYNASNIFQNQTFNNLVLAGTGGTRNFTFSNALNIKTGLTTISSNISLPSISPTSSTLTINAAGNVTLSGNPGFTNKTINATFTSSNALFDIQGTLTLQGSPGSAINATFSGTGGIFSITSHASLTNSSINAGFAASSSSPGLLRFNGTLNLSSGSAINLTGNYAGLASNNNSTSISASNINLLSANQRFDISSGHTLSFSNTSAIKLLGANGILDFGGNVNINGANSTNYIQLGSTSKVVKQISQNSSFAFPIGTSNNYLPVTINSGNGGGNPDFTVGVFQGATTDAQPGGPASYKPPIVDAIWTVQQDGNNSKNVTMSFGWQDGLEGTVFSGLPNNQLGLSSFNTSNSSWNAPISGTGVNGTTNTFLTSNYALSGSNGTNSFAIGQLGILLPILSRDFTAAPQDGRVILNWTGFATSVNAYFEVERSNSANNQFIKIATIPVRLIGEDKYQFVDAHPSKSQSFYRIKIIDELNRASYMNTLKVNMGGTEFALQRLYPTLATSQVNLLISSPQNKQALLTILDQQGRMVSKQNLSISTGSLSYPINISRLTGGQYFLLISNGDERIQARFIKQ